MAIVELITNPATTSWKCPPNVYYLQIECWNAGGRAWASGDGSWLYGGSGGGYGRKNSYAVTPGKTYNLQVGVGDGTSSAVSYFNNTGTVSGSIGDVTYAGGSGGRVMNQSHPAGYCSSGGGGGGGAGSSANGGNGDGINPGTGGAGGGGNGGKGTGGGSYNCDPSANGGAYGGGAGYSNNAEGTRNGGPGLIKLTYTKVVPAMVLSSEC